jgi:hypothetical protein
MFFILNTARATSLTSPIEFPMNFSYLIFFTRNIPYILIVFQFLFKLKKVENFIERLDFFCFNILYVHCFLTIKYN